MGKWQFNQDLLRDTIKVGQQFLLYNTLSNKEKVEITSDIIRFQKFLNGDFENFGRKRNLSFKNAKNNIIRTMKKYSKLFDKNLRDWFIELSQSEVFSCEHEIQPLVLSTDEMAAETLNNYQKKAPVFYKLAKEILVDSNMNLVQEAVMDSCSYCFYSDILALPFVVINKEDGSYVLNHELEHGIEYYMNTNTHPLYHEYGPIYFESLFNDHLYQKYGSKVLSSSLERIADADYFLANFTIYLCVMHEFERQNFEVDDEQFKQTFNYFTDLDGEELLDFLNDEMVEAEISETLGYLLSLLKAIETRDYHLRKNDNCNYIFNDILFSKKFKFNPPVDGFDPYIRFVEEVKQKVK